MTEQAERGIAQAFANSTEPTGTFNVLIEAMEEEAMANGMPRDRLLALLLNAATATAGAGRSNTRRTNGPEAMIYKTIQDSTMAARTGVDALRQTRPR